MKVADHPDKQHATTLAESDAAPQSELVCRGCGMSLQGVSHDGRCPQCSLAVAKSLPAVVPGVESSGELSRFAMGLEAQQWAVKLGLLVAVVGTMQYARHFQVPVVAEVVAAGMSLAGAVWMGCWWRDLPESPLGSFGGGSSRVAAVAGTGAMALCSLPLSLTHSSQVSPLMYAGFLLCGVCWCTGEVAKLHIVQQVSEYVSDARMYRQARSLRWGTWGLLIALVLSVVFSFPNRGPITPGLFLMLAASSLVVFSLLTAATYGRASRVVQQQALYKGLLESGRVRIQAAPVSARSKRRQ